MSAVKYSHIRLEINNRKVVGKMSSTLILNNTIQKGNSKRKNTFNKMIMQYAENVEHRKKTNKQYRCKDLALST